MTPSPAAAFAFRCPPLDARDPRVVRWSGVERLSAPFRFELLLWLAPEGVPSAPILGAEASFTIEVGGQRRVVSGVLDRAETTHPLAGFEDRVHLRVRLVPCSALTGRRKRSRVFQELTAPEIAARVLGEHGVACVPAGLRAYATRDVCVQYAESDRRFVERILAEEGIVHRFDHGAERETVVLADAPAACDLEVHALGLSFAAHSEGGDPGNRVTALAHVERARPTKSTLREYDFERPSFLLEGEAEVAAGHPEIEVYEHHGEHGGLDVDERAAARRLEALRRDASVWVGQSRAPALEPGRVFELSQAPRPEDDRAYRVVRVEHAGQAAELAGDGAPTYSNRFECIAPDRTPRPRRRPRKLQEALLTATVVGPEGHEIWTDRHGRVRVRFHWDRESPHDGSSYGWVRVAQTWAGTGWGFQFIPRVGMEVLVAFVGGDLDRPLIVAAVPNVKAPVPFPLPDHKTRSGVRTQSSPGGGGYNEISFEDAAGDESLHLRAQRELDVRVLEDYRESVARDKAVDVARNLATRVGGAREIVTGAAETRTIGADLSETVAGAATLSARGDLRRETDGAVLERSAGARIVEVGAACALKVSEGVAAGIGTDLRASIGGVAVVRAERSLHASSAGRLDLAAQKRASLSAGGGIECATGDDDAFARLRLEPKGVGSVEASRRIEVAAGEAVEVRIGDTTLSVSDGEIVLRSKRIRLEAEEVVMTSEDASLRLKDKLSASAKSVELEAAGGGRLSLSDRALLDGPAIKLGEALGVQRALAEKRKQELEAAPRSTLHLFDRRGEPMTRAAYRVAMPGWTETGKTSNGTVRIPAFPGVESCVVSWGTPLEERGPDESREPYTFSTTVWLRTATDDPDETLRRKLENMGHVGPHLEAAMATVPSEHAPGGTRAAIEAAVVRAIAEKRPLKSGGEP